jgi:hypothetical protein
MSSQTSRKVDGAGSSSGSGHASSGDDQPSGGLAARIAFAWAFVGIPLAYGIYETAKKAAALFTG